MMSVEAFSVSFEANKDVLYGVEAEGNAPPHMLAESESYENCK